MLDIEILQGHSGRTMSSAAERPAAPGAESGHAGDQGQNVPPSPTGPSKAAVGVLGSAPVGARLLVCSSGNVTDEVIPHYIKHQGAEPEYDDRFRVTET